LWKTEQRLFWERFSIREDFRKISDQRDRATQQRHDVERAEYAHRMRDAVQAWEQGYFPEACRYLDECPWEQRGWEHEYLFGQLIDGHAILFRHFDSIDAIEWNPDGTVIACASGQKILLIDSSSGKQLHNLDFITSALRYRDVQEIAFAPDGKTLAAIYGRDEVRIWRVADGQLLRFIEPVGTPFRRITFDPTGDRLTVVAEDGKLLVWDIQ